MKIFKLVFSTLIIATTINAQKKELSPQKQFADFEHLAIKYSESSRPSLWRKLHADYRKLSPLLQGTEIKPTKNDFTPLHAAIIMGDAKLVAALVQNKEFINNLWHPKLKIHRGGFGLSPLLTAVFAYNTHEFAKKHKMQAAESKTYCNIIETLINAGATLQLDKHLTELKKGLKSGSGVATIGTIDKTSTVNAATEEKQHSSEYAQLEKMLNNSIALAKKDCPALHKAT